MTPTGAKVVTTVSAIDSSIDSSSSINPQNDHLNRWTKQ